METKRQFAAFISYRHLPLEKEVAKRVHTAIEHYKVPEEYRESYGGDRLGLVFRDEEELPASASLTESIKEALDVSRFLIVICTPQTKESVWVAREIEYFMQGHDRAHVLAVLVQGTPESSFPPALLHRFASEMRSMQASDADDVEPLAANLTNESHNYQKNLFRREITRIYAAIIGCPFDALWQRERRYQQRRRMRIMTALLAAAAVFSGVVLYQNTQIKNRNREIEEQNAEISRQNTELLQRETEILTSEGRLLLDKGNRYGAVRNGLEALPTKGNDRPYDPNAEALLIEALGAYSVDVNRLRAETAISQRTEIKAITISEDGGRAYTLDMFGDVRCFNTKTGEELWTSEGLDEIEYVTDIFTHSLIEVAEKEMLICNSSTQLRAISTKDGHLLWQQDPEVKSDLRTMSPTGNHIMIMDYIEAEPEETSPDTDTAQEPERIPRLKLIDLKDGSIVAEAGLKLPEDLKERYILPMYSLLFGENNGAFSDTEKRFACAVGYEKKNPESVLGREDAIAYFEWNLEEDTIQYFGGEVVFSGINDIIGMTYLQEDSLNICRVDKRTTSVRLSRVGTQGREDISEVRQTLKNIYGIIGRPDARDHMRYMVGKNVIVVCVNDNIHQFRRDNGQYLGSERCVSEIIYTDWLDDEKKTIAVVLSNGGLYTYGLWDGTESLSTSESLMLNFVAIGQVYDVAANKPLFQREKGSDSRERRITEDIALVSRHLSDEKTIIVNRHYINPNQRELPQELKGRYSVSLGISPESEEWVISTQDEVNGEHDVYLLNRKTKKITYWGSSGKSRIYGTRILLSQDKKTIFEKNGSAWFKYDGKGEREELGREKEPPDHYFGLIPGSGFAGSIKDRVFSGGIMESEWDAYSESPLFADYMDEYKELLSCLYWQWEDGSYRMIEPESDTYWEMNLAAEEQGSSLFKSNRYTGSFIRSGSNGYILVGEALHEEAERVEQFALYHAETAERTVIQNLYKEKEAMEIVMAHQAPMFAAMCGKEKVYLYRIPTDASEINPEEEGTGETAAGSSSELRIPTQGTQIQGVSFADDDSHLVVWTEDMRVYIYNTTDGSLVHAEEEAWEPVFRYSFDDLTMYHDAENSRIIMEDGHNFLVLDKSTYTVLHEGDGFQAYDPVTRELYLWFSDTEPAIIPLKTTKELTDWASNVIGQ